MPYTKPYLAVLDQIALIKSRGMGISDDNLAKSHLEKIGYYRLSGYWFPYRKSSSINGKMVVSDDFRSDTQFSEIDALYVFDKKLRMLLLDALERIEIALRVQITLQMGKYSPDAHRNTTHLHPNFWQRTNPITLRSKHVEWLRRHDDAFTNSKEEFVKHFKEKYPGENPPLWIAAELWDFGAMSVLFSGLNKSDQIDIAAKFQIPTFRIMETWLRSLNVSRNICAHHSRLWNKASAVQPSWPNATQVPDLAHIAGNTHAQTRVYGTACMCAYLLRTINPTSSWRSRFKDLISEFPNSKIISALALGFTQDWENEKIWN